MVIVAVVAFITLFSIVAVVLHGDDAPSGRDPRNNPLIWGYIGRR